MIEDLVIPTHIGIIMDGNGRWAERRGLSRSMGHREGANTLKKNMYLCWKNRIEVFICLCFFYGKF